jgi:hypothetical protein
MTRHRPVTLGGAARVALCALAAWTFCPTAHAQRLDLDAAQRPQPADGGVLAAVAKRLRTEAARAAAGVPAHRPTEEDANLRVTHLFLSHLDNWLGQAIKAGPRSPDFAAALSQDTLALLGCVDALQMARERSAAVPRTRLAIETLVCLCEMGCGPVFQASPNDDQMHDPLLRAIAAALAEAASPESGVLADLGEEDHAPSIDAIVRTCGQLGWSDPWVESLRRDCQALAGLATTDPVVARWLSPRLDGLAAVLVAIQSASDGGRGELIARAEQRMLRAGGEGGGTPESLPRLLDDAFLTARMLRCVESLSLGAPQREAAALRQAAATARAQLLTRWAERRSQPSDGRVLRAFRPVLQAQQAAIVERPAATKQRGPVLVENALRASLATASVELMAALPSMLEGQAELARPEVVSLIARHQALSQRLGDFLDLPGMIELLELEKRNGVDGLLIGRSINRLGALQRATASADHASAEQSHAMIGAYARFHRAHRQLDQAAIAALCHAIDRPAIARANWADASQGLRRAVLTMVADSEPTPSTIASVQAIAEALELMVSLARAAQADNAALLSPMIRHAAGPIERAMAEILQKRTTMNGARLAELRATVQTVDMVRELLREDAVASAALASLLGQPNDPSALLPVMRHAGRPWASYGAERLAAANATRWIGELHHAITQRRPEQEVKAMAEYARELIQQWHERADASR